MYDHGFQIEFTPVEWLDVCTVLIYVIVIITENVWFLFILWTVMIQKFGFSLCSDQNFSRQRLHLRLILTVCKRLLTFTDLESIMPR